MWINFFLIIEKYDWEKICSMLKLYKWINESSFILKKPSCKNNCTNFFLYYFYMKWVGELNLAD